MTIYGTAAGFTTYHTARGTDVSAFDDDAVIESALLVSTEYIDAKYRSSFPGLKIYDRDQIREWPRYDAVDMYDQIIPSGTIPIEVEQATYQAALKQLLTPGSLSVDWTPNKYKSASVDGAVSVQYMQYDTAADIQTRFRLIEEILAPLLGGKNSTSSSHSGFSVRV